jgi:hypothetical protein
MARGSGHGSDEWFLRTGWECEVYCHGFCSRPGPQFGYYIATRHRPLSLLICLRVPRGGSSIAVGPFVLDFITGALIPNDIGYVV